MFKNKKVNMTKKSCLIIIICMIFLLTNLINSNRVKVFAANSNSIDEVFAEGEKGPIDLNDESKGVQQIKGAGVVDENFAKAIWDAFKKDSYQGDNEQTIRQILAGYTGNIDASNRGIKSIVGIMWLRNTKSIDFSNKYDAVNPDIKNQISDLTPLSIDYIMSIGNISNENEALGWFKQRGNLTIKLEGNPITKYADLVGRMLLRISGNVPILETNQLNAIKNGGELNWSVTKQINLPKLEKNGQEVKFSDEMRDEGRVTRILITTINEEAYINYNQLNNNILEIANIRYSGNTVLRTGISIDDSIVFYKNQYIAGYDIQSPDGATFDYGATFNVRIYMPVTSEKYVKSNIKVKKSATHNDSGKQVAGAKYYLYDAKTNEKVSDKEYVTDENGEFLLDEYLSCGEYYFKEFEAPEGFLINEDKISFSVVTDQCDVRVSGGDKNLNINTGDISEDPNTVYIDRYSNNVEVNITDNPNYTLDHLELTYFDRNTQKFETVKGPNEETMFTTTQEVEEWINNNKGNNQTPGIIDGEVKIKAYIIDNTDSKEITTSDQRSVTNVEFTKKGKEESKKGEVINNPLAGATFKLECTHKHTEQCKDEQGSYSQCIDPHTDSGHYITDEGCIWNTTAISGEDGKVIFDNINTGVYKMTEIQTPKGYIQPETTWRVTVDAAKNEFIIEEEKLSGNGITVGSLQDGYTIINEKIKEIEEPEKPNKHPDNDKPINIDKNPIEKQPNENVKTNDSTMIMTNIILGLFAFGFSITLRRDKRHL